MAKKELNWPQNSKGKRQRACIVSHRLLLDFSTVHQLFRHWPRCQHTVLALDTVGLRMAVPLGLVRQEHSEEHQLILVPRRLLSLWMLPSSLGYLLFLLFSLDVFR